MKKNGKAKGKKVATTITAEQKKALFNCKVRFGTTYAELIRKALKEVYGI